MFADQWRTLHLSRALSLTTRPIILLVDPTRGMSPAQKDLLFQFMRECLCEDQVVALVTTDSSVGPLADHVVTLKDFQSSLPTSSDRSLHGTEGSV
jgi:ABC-type branched-subunit amino acid transport system ATPase component